MFYLAIETSCDETSIALLYQDKSLDNLTFVGRLNLIRVLSQVISSQIKIHQQYGGVVPEIGARQHANQIHFLLNQVLDEATINIRKDSELKKLIDFEDSEDTKSQSAELLKYITKIFVTTEPGLPSALRVGLEFAKTLQYFSQQKYGVQITLQPVNHLRGHLASCFYNMQ